MVGTLPSGSVRKSLDAEINLVPFIDLLSMCICFLLMTAVWVQLGTVEVKQSHGTGAAAPTSQFEMNVSFKKKDLLSLSITKRGKSFKGFEIPRATFGTRLAVILRSLDSTHPGETGLISAAFITSRPDVSYGDLISVLDLLRKHQVVNLGILPAKEVG